MKKQHIFTAIIIIVIAALFGFKYYSNKNPEAFGVKKEQVVESKSAPVNTPDGTEVKNSGYLIHQPVKVKTDVPINGTYKGVIEVGASGFNAFVVNIDQDKNWELVAKEFGKSLAYEGFASTSDVYDKMKDYIGIITDKGVAGRNIHFVISSGALKNPKMGLIAKAIQEKGFTVNKVTADQEGKYALKASLPKAYRAEGYSVDMGSGNTKISWYEGDNKLKTIELPGAKYYQDGKTDADVYAQVQEAAMLIPIQNRKYAFVIGGVPFSLAKQVRAGDERFTQLSSPDEYSAGDDIKVKSGLNIYRAIAETTKTDSFIFDWDANFTIGFLMTLN